MCVRTNRVQQYIFSARAAEIHPWNFKLPIIALEVVDSNLRSRNQLISDESPFRNMISTL